MDFIILFNKKQAIGVMPLLLNWSGPSINQKTVLPRTAYLPISTNVERPFLFLEEDHCFLLSILESDFMYISLLHKRKCVSPFFKQTVTQLETQSRRNIFLLYFLDSSASVCRCLLEKEQNTSHCEQYSSCSTGKKRTTN